MSYRQTVCNPALNLTLDRGDTLVHGEIDKGAFDNRRQQTGENPIMFYACSGSWSCLMRNAHRFEGR
jgi:hypothetical protein